MSFEIQVPTTAKRCKRWDVGRRWLVGGVVLFAFASGCGEQTAPGNNPTPGIDALSPPDVDQGRADLTLTVSGSDFVSSSLVRLNGSERATQFVSRTELRATLPAADFTSSGAVQIVVVNPAPGGGTSNAASLTVKARTNPVPVVSGLSPQFVLAGSTGATLTIAGTGFVQQSRVFLGFTEKQVTFVSPSQLRIAFTDTETAVAGTTTIRVTNPAPGGGTSNTVTLEMRSPVPVITSLGQTQTTAGQETFTLRVEGSGFVNASAVRFNGAPRATRRVAAGALEATLLEGDLRATGAFVIDVMNPAPGGGASNTLAFNLVAGVPEVTLLPSQGASAGRSGFSLYVHGRGFLASSVVRWNGVDRPTQYLSATRLAATISAADVTQPGTAQISVANPAPGGGTSAQLPFTIRQLGATTVIASRTVAIKANDLAFDSRSGRVYLSVPGSVTINGNSVVAIDPTTATITGSVFVGSEPGRVALSDNGQYLYVGLNGANAVRRVELPSLTPGLQWSVGAGLVAGDMGVVPGVPNTVAVSRQSPGTSPPLVGVTIYDDGVARPTSSPGHTGGNRIEFLQSSSVLYGYNNAHTGFEFFTIGIDASGARHTSEKGGLIGGFYTDIVGAAGRIYGTDGSIVDAEQRTRVGSFNQAGGSLAIDAALGRAYMLIDTQILVYDLNSFQLLGTIPISPATFDHPAVATSRLVRWGTNGLAFIDQTRLFIVQSPIIGP